MTDVTHEQLHTEIAVLHEKSVNRDVQIDLIRTDIGKIFHNLSELKDAVTEIKTSRETVHSAITGMEASIKALTAAENQRIGREGVWAAVMRSPVAGWIAAAGAVLAGIVSWLGGKH